MTPSLTSQTISRSELTPPTIQQMFAVFNENFAQTSPEIFQRDLNNKDWVILLRDEQNRLQGFSTLALYETEFESQKISVVYSGDTVICKEYWGTPQLPSTWIKTVLEKSKAMQQPLYWLLISSGYKTYRFLSVFYNTFYPHYACPTPPHIQALMRHLALQRFGADYIPELGVVRFTIGATPLRDGVAAVTDERLHDPHVAHYIKMNPHHDQGDELVCITQVHPDNFTPAGRRMAR
jgi:hypothetical protein